MTSKSSASAKFIDLHAHQLTQSEDKHSAVTIYSYSPQINDLPDQGQFYSAGVHPWKLENAQDSFKEVTELSTNEYCLMIGEAGLDRTIQTSLELQEEIFKKHIILANKLCKPLVIHNVRSLSDIFRLHKSYPNHSPWVLHDFNGSITDLRNCHQRKIYTSLGPRFYESTTAKIGQTVLNNKIELEYIFFETDDRSDLQVVEVYQHFSKIQGIDTNTLKDQIWKNLEALLGKNSIVS